MCIMHNECHCNDNLTIVHFVNYKFCFYFPRHKVYNYSRGNGSIVYSVVNHKLLEEFVLILTKSNLMQTHPQHYQLLHVCVNP